MFGVPAKKVLEQMLIDAPGLAGRLAHQVGARARLTMKVPVRLTSMILRQCVEIDIVPGDERHDRGVVDEDVDAARRASYLGEQRLDRCRIGNVALRPRMRRSADRCGRRLGALRVDVADDDARAIGGQPRGDRLADALRRAGDERRLSRKPTSHFHAP